MATRKKTKKPRSGVCQQCGCTDDEACPGGCSWADKAHTMCSTCAFHLMASLALESASELLYQNPFPVWCALVAIIERPEGGAGVVVYSRMSEKRLFPVLQHIGEEPEAYLFNPEHGRKNSNGGHSLGKCKCGAPPRPLHPCPYDQDLHNDKTPSCNCCEACQAKCAREL